MSSASGERSDAPILAFGRNAGPYNRRMDIARLLIVAVLVAIIFSLGSALFQLSRGKGDSGKMLKALTWRIGLSVGLFLVLLVAWRMGLIRPHGM